MDMEREANSIAEGMKGLFGLMRGELVATKGDLAALKGELAAVREELNRQRERVLMLERRSAVVENEVNALRRALSAVGERSVATAAVVEERGRELAAVKGEVTAVKGEVTSVKGEVTAVKGEVTSVKGEVTIVKEKLTEHKGDMAEQLARIERRGESDLRELHEKARKRKAVSADGPAQGNVDIPNPPTPLSAADKAFMKQMFRPWIKASTVHDAWRLWNSPFGGVGLTLRDEMAAGGFTKKYALVTAEDSAMQRQKRLMVAVSEYVAARSGGFEEVVRILDDIGARVGFTTLRDGLTVRSGKASSESFEDLRKNQRVCEKVKVALELVRAASFAYDPIVECYILREAPVLALQPPCSLLLRYPSSFHIAPQASHGPRSPPPSPSPPFLFPFPSFPSHQIHLNQLPTCSSSRATACLCLDTHVKEVTARLSFAAKEMPSATLLLPPPSFPLLPPPLPLCQ
ncbi:unnamed protein product [Closterium sp. Naga37s-1]|nr:unnamed protein product [Closterium sp. Naga37s-1]